jgi:hypothetical protein
MDELVRQAMAKWPNVPAVFGWLALDLRGNWLLRQERIGNALLNDFISRNYAHDDAGRWFFQNGPQRVFVRLAYAPWVLRMDDGNARLVTHTGLAVERVDRAWLDEDGVLILETEHGAGILDDRDADAFSRRFVDAAGQTTDDDTLLELVEAIAAGADAGLHLPYGSGSVRIGAIASEDVPVRLGFVRDPQPEADAASRA